MKTARVLRMCWCGFSEEEVRTRGVALAEFEKRVDELREKQKKLTAEFRDQVKQLEEEIGKTSSAIVAKGEEREVECEVRFHSPTVGRKEIYRSDTGEKVAEGTMSFEECQENLFEGKEEAAGA
jgi:hypothetical protein